MTHLNKAYEHTDCLHKAHHGPRGLRNTRHTSVLHMGTILNSKIPKKPTKTTTKSVQHEPKETTKMTLVYSMS